MREEIFFLLFFFLFPHPSIPAGLSLLVHVDPEIMPESSESGMVLSK